MYAMSRITWKFAVLQGLYWIGACVVCSFAERLLTAYGCSVQQVGLIMAGANGAALLLQPLLADLADRTDGPSLKSEILGAMALSIVLALFQLFPAARLLTTALLFGAMSAVTLSIQPMLNAVGFAYVDRGDAIDYSLARGIASAVFAAFCFLAGYLAEWRLESLLWAYMLANFGILCLSIVFAPGKTRKAKARVPHTGTVALLKKHPYLLYFLFGTVLTFATHNFLNAYMLSIVKTIGKGTHEMSAAIALAAVLEIPTMAGFSRLMKRFRLESMLLASSVGFTVKHLLLLLPLCFGAGIWSVYLSQAVQLLGFALFIPAASFFLNARMDAADKVKGQMLLTEAQTVGSILGQLVGGFGIARIGIAATMGVGCVLSLIGLALFWLCVRADRLARKDARRLA